LYTDFETGQKKKTMNEVGYTQDDIDECSMILDEYIDDLVMLKEPKSNEQIVECVEKVIKRLNNLNEKCEFSLIETDQREELVPFIIDAAELAGLVTDK